MKPLTLESLQELVANETRTIEFPARGCSVTVRQLKADETSRVVAQTSTVDDNDQEANHQADILVASICITDANYDTDEGREALSKLPRAMLRKIADTILGLNGADGVVVKN